MGLCTAFVFAALVEFTIVNFWFRKHRKSKENALALMLPFVSTASNLTAATQMSAAAKTENTMRANQKKVKTSFKIHIFRFSLSYTEFLTCCQCWLRENQFNFLYEKEEKGSVFAFLLAIEWKLSPFNSLLPLLYSFKKVWGGFYPMHVK